ncbi:3-dehydroquinate synthase [Lachnoclostridium sp. An14]|uniref:3-dehydroquinate synthase n=1 Tax=Lachnoclostridium sp. An14 TaxID=1965562 RepID=UPI000B3962BF|nr:3-dehydroquinate synthase [Lachnoclostridium sp. An14]OUQ21783.1 3-dehydroquinate synthase [Lachnoclostridium sp. An14]
MSERMTIHLDGRSIYDIVLETSFGNLGREAAHFVSGRKVCIVTDSNVAELYLNEVGNILASCCSRVVNFVFPAGEEYKNLDTVQKLYETLILEKFDRKDVLVALGGGVVGDLCGFAAATYLRGVSFLQIPTTLLSQVDSSIGGKTGVDFLAYKNMVGAFHMPKMVYSNMAVLQTLSEEQFSSGMGEVIKHGLIQNGDYYRWLEDCSGEIMERRLQTCEEMILSSDLIKQRVVEEDPKEQGVRALLNFGHTLGHAIEKEKQFAMLHGHCVGLGCLAAAYISHLRGNIPLEEVERLSRVLSRFGLPVTVSGLTPEQILQATKNDKKMDAGTVKFVLLERIGDAYVDRTVSEEEMRQGLSYILR